MLAGMERNINHQHCIQLKKALCLSKFVTYFNEELAVFQEHHFKSLYKWCFVPHKFVVELSLCTNNIVQHNLYDVFDQYSSC